MRDYKGWRNFREIVKPEVQRLRTPSMRRSENAPFTHSARKRATCLSAAKHDDLGGAVPCPAVGGRHRVVRTGKSVKCSEGASAGWHGYACVDAQLQIS